MPEIESPAKILVVDHEPHLRRAVVRLLREAGHEVLEAPTGQEGLPLVAETKPDLILLDAALPDLDTIEVCRSIKRAAEPARAYVLLLSDQEIDAGDWVDGLQGGADGCLRRGVPDHELLAQVAVLLRLKRAEDGQRQTLAEALQATQALRDSEQRYRSLVEQSLDGLRMTDEAGRIVEWNSRCEEILGLTRSQVLGRAVWDVLYQLVPDDRRSPEALARLKAKSLDFLRTGLAAWHDAEQVHTIQRPDGALRFIEERVFPIRVDGQVLACGIVRDVTEREQAVEALRQSEERFRLLTDNVGGAFWLGTAGVGDQRQVLYVSRAFEEIFGLSVEDPNELDGAWLARVHPEDRERTLQALEEFLRNHGAYDVEYRIVRPDGQVRWIWARGFPIRDEQGVIHRTGGIAEDITDRVQAAEELRSALRREQYLADIIRNASVAVAVGYPDGRLGISNRAFQELTGYGQEELAAVDWNLALTPPEWREHEAARLQELHRTKGPVRYEKEYIRKDGSRVPIELLVHPQLGSEGEVESYVAFITDLSVRKGVEEALRQQTHQLGERVKELNCLFGMAALVEQPGISLGEILQGTVDLIPPAWLYPEITTARILLDDQEFRSEGLVGEPCWRQAAEVLVHGQPSGLVEVCYLEERPERDEGPFIAEERSLLDAIAQRLGRIVERLRADGALQESEARLQALTASTPTYIYELDPQGVIRFANRTYEGLTREDVIGSHLLDWFPEPQRPGIKAMVERVFGSGESQSTEYTIPNPRGELRSYATEITPVPAGDRVASAVLTATDITERVRAREALREANRRRDALFHGARDAIMVVDPESGQILEVNDQAEWLVKRSRLELVGSHYTSLSPQELQARHEQIFREIGRTGSRAPVETEVLTSEGQRVPVAISASVVELAGGRRVLQGLFRDVTERKRTEEELQRSRAELERRVEELAAVHRSSQRLQQLESPQTVAQAILSVLEETLAYEYGAVLLTDESSGRLVPFALSARGRSPESMEDDGAVAASQGLSLGQGISGWVAQTGQSVRLGDVRQDPRYYPVRENIRSELCVPLRYGDRILGVVNVETPTPDAYTGADERVLETVAAQMAVAIANAQLFGQVQRQAAELEERVARRTAELAAINEQLQCEVLERRRAEEALLRSHRALQTLSECNHVLAYAESESDLLQYICRIVVEIGGYRLAWVGFAEHDAARTVRPVAQAGFEEGYLETLDITWADCERGRGPTGTAIRTGQPTPSREIQTDPRFAPWRAEAIRRGYASSLALPLRTRGQILGSLNIYAAEADAFDAEETELLAEVADNLAFGIEALRARVDRQRAEEALRQRAEELSVLHAIGHQVGGSLSPEEVVQAALQGIVDTVAPDLAMLYLRQGEQMVLQGAAASEPRLQAVGPEVKRVGECLCGLAASEGRPFYSSNIAADPLCTLEECKRAGMHSFAALPLLKGADVLGVVGLGSLRERVFSEQATVLEALAGEIAIGLQNALLHQQVRRHAADLEREVGERRRAEEELASKTEELARSHAFLSALTLVSTHLQTTVDPGQVLDLLGTELRALGLTSLVALMEPGATELDLHYASVPPTVLTRIERVAGFRLQGFRVPADAWPVASAVEQRRALYVPDPLPALAGLVPGVPEPLLHRIARVLGIAPDFPAVFLPLAVEEQPIGVLAVWGADLQAVDLPALSIFAGQVAVAFERARLTREAADAEILRELARLRSELVANVSHEIRTPLGLIQVFCTSLLMDDIDLDRETQRQFLGGIRDEAERLTAIVDNLLNLGRIDSGRFRLHWRPTDLGQLTSQILPTLQSQVIEHRLVQEFPPEPLVARVDPKQIEQVLRNLLTNAIHYSPGGGLVTVEGQRQGRQVVLCVRDEGIGIPAAEQERIFERFYRVDSDLTREVSGVGLGLAVCQGIVEAHGGRIWVESAPGQGSSFYFTLPLLDPEDLAATG